MSETGYGELNREVYPRFNVRNTYFFSETPAL